MVPGGKRLSREGQALASFFLKPNWTEMLSPGNRKVRECVLTQRGGPVFLSHFLESRRLIEPMVVPTKKECRTVVRSCSRMQQDKTQALKT